MKIDIQSLLTGGQAPNRTEAVNGAFGSLMDALLAGSDLPASLLTQALSSGDEDLRNALLDVVSEDAETINGPLLSLPVEDRAPWSGDTGNRLLSDVIVPVTIDPAELPVTEEMGDETVETHQFLSEEGVEALPEVGKEAQSMGWQLQQLVTQSAEGASQTDRVRTEATAARGFAEASGMSAPHSPAETTVMAATWGEAPSGFSKNPLIQKGPAVAIQAVLGTNDTAGIISQPESLEAVGDMPEPEHNIVSAPTPSVSRSHVVQAASAGVTVMHAPETQEWKQAVSQHIALFSRNGLSSVEIRLHPEDLGALQISIRLHQDQAQVHIVSEHAHVRHAMEQALPQLRTAMAEAGMQLENASVGADGSSTGTGARGREDADPQQARNEESDLTKDEELPVLVQSIEGDSLTGINTFA